MIVQIFLVAGLLLQPLFAEAEQPASVNAAAAFAAAIEKAKLQKTPEVVPKVTVLKVEEKPQKEVQTLQQVIKKEFTAVKPAVTLAVSATAALPISVVVPVVAASATVVEVKKSQILLKPQQEKVVESVAVSATVIEAKAVSATAPKQVVVSATAAPSEFSTIIWKEKPKPSMALPIDRYRSIFPPSYAPNGMVVSEDALATKVGVEILKNGGNAIDAAVAVGFTLAVTYPRAGNLGGGGFMLIHNNDEDKTVAIDYREVAPAAAHANMFLDAAGDLDIDEARYSYNSAGVPGTVKGLLMAHAIYGKLSRRQVMAPAIFFAEKGFDVTAHLASSLKAKQTFLSKHKAAKSIFYKKDGSHYRVGDKFIQKDLAWSLKQISKYGADAFYKGAIAKKMSADMAKHGGSITAEDLAKYEALLREPIEGTYRGYRIVSMPPPSSGGVHLIQMLNLLEKFPIPEYGAVSANTIHILAEVMKRAYADRSKYMGDPDFVRMPLKGLLSKLYAARQKKSISMESATPSELVSPGEKMPYESKQTTHFTVMDSEGNVVSNTYTLNFSYGSGIVATGTGILLNNEMDDFSAKPGVPNAYGLLGGEANKIEAGKRPLSSMTPTIVFKGKQPVLATGSPGGSQIITTVLQVISHIIDHGMSLSAATVTPRVHHQWLPDELVVEEGLSPDTLEILENKGYNIFIGDTMGSTQSIVPVKGGFEGISDPRRPGGLALGY